MTISPERERQLCSWSRYPSDALRAIQFLIGRVRELEKREAELMESLVDTLGGFRSLASQFGDMSNFDAAIVDRARKALEGAP